MALTRRACSLADTKGFLFLAWLPLVLAIAIYFHHQCFLLLSRTDHEELFLSIRSDIVVVFLAYFVNFLSFSSAVTGMVSFSLLLRACSAKFFLSSIHNFLYLQPHFLLRFLVGTTAQRLILDKAHHTWW